MPKQSLNPTIVLNELRHQSSLLKSQLQLFETQIAELQHENRIRQAQLENEEQCELNANKVIGNLAEHLKELQNDMNQSYNNLQVPKLPDLSLTQNTKLMAFKMIMNNEISTTNMTNDSLISYLHSFQWNIYQAIDDYYENKYNSKYVWEWYEEDQNKWIPYIREKAQRFNTVQVGKKHDFKIQGHNYTFHKLTPDTASQTEILKQYQVISTDADIQTHSPLYDIYYSFPELITLKTGDSLYHKHKSDKFLAATIINRNGTCLHIHYDGWEKKWDTWSDYTKETQRFAKTSPLYSFKEAEKLKIGDSIQHRDKHGNIYAAEIMDKKDTKLHIHYDGFIKAHDEWCDYQTELGKFLKLRCIVSGDDSCMSLAEADKLKIGHILDHQDDDGLFCTTKVIDKKKTNLHLHYEGWDDKWNAWSDYKKEPRRFARWGSISQRKSHRLQHLCTGDWVRINPIRKDPNIGWVYAEIMKIRQGQIKVKYNGEQYYWVHMDMIEEVKAAKYMSCTVSKDNESKEVDKLTPGTIVTVEEADGVHCRISQPCNGWVSFYSYQGKTMLNKIREDIITRQVRRNKHGNKVHTEYPEFWEDEAYYHDFDTDKLYNMASNEMLVKDYHDVKCIEINIESSFAQSIIKQIENVQDSEKEYTVFKIESIQNKNLWDKYRAAKNTMIKAIGADKVKEQYLWACSSVMSADDIAKQGFRKEYFNGNHLYKDITSGVLQQKFICSCITLCGEFRTKPSQCTLKNWPIKANNQLYDVLVDDMDNPDEYTFHDDSRIYPMFIVHIKDITFQPIHDITSKIDFLHSFTTTKSQKLSYDESGGFTIQQDADKQRISNTYFLFDTGLYSSSLTKMEFKLNDYECYEMRLYCSESKRNINDLSSATGCTILYQCKCDDGYHFNKKTTKVIHLDVNAKIEVSRYLILELEHKKYDGLKVETVKFYRKANGLLVNGYIRRHTGENKNDNHRLTSLMNQFLSA